MKHSHRLRLALAILAAVGWSQSAQADFVDAEVGSRGLSMGGAFVSVTGDPASLYWNPAAILSDKKIQFAGMRAKAFDSLDDVNEDFLGLTVQIRDGLALGVGWTRTGLTDVYYEDVITTALAYEVLPDRLTLGASALFYGADAPGYEALNDPNYLGRQWEPSFSLGAIYRWSEVLQFGLSVENLLKPEISLLSTTGDIDEIGGRRRVGASYLLQEIVRLSAEVRHHDFPEYVDKSVTVHMGAESFFSEVLALRLGIDDGDLTVGAGLIVDKVRTDLGLVTNERLGNSYRADITVGF